LARLAASRHHRRRPPDGLHRLDIGAYKNTVDGTVQQIGVARGLGAAGVVLFSYDFMARQGGMRPGESYLLAVRDRAFR